MFHTNLTRIALAVGVALTSTAAFAETVTIRYSNWLPATHFLWTDVLQPFTQEIEKATEGRVKVEVLPKVVGSAAQQFDVVRDGLADMSFITSAYTPGRFVTFDLGELPLRGGDMSVLAPAFDGLFRKYMEDRKEFTEVKVLSAFTMTPSQVFTVASKPVKSVSDLKGLKLRSANAGMTEALLLLDAIPVSKSATEAYEMLSTGALDGQVTIPNTLTGFNQLDVTKNAYLMPGGLATSANMVAINNAKWAEISEKDRQIILDLGTAKLAKHVGEAYIAADKLALEEMKKAGYTIVEASAEDVTELRTRLKGIEEKWIQRAKEAGFDKAEEALAEYNAVASASN